MSDETISEAARQLGSRGGSATAKRADLRIITEPGRQAAFRRFLDEVDPDQKLAESERIRRAEDTRRSHMRRIQTLSVESRNARKASRGDAL
jgi:hypothetical protein